MLCDETGYLGSPGLTTAYSVKSLNFFYILVALHCTFPDHLASSWSDQNWWTYATGERGYQGSKLTPSKTINIFTYSGSPTSYLSGSLNFVSIWPKLMNLWASRQRVLNFFIWAQKGRFANSFANSNKEKIKFTICKNWTQDHINNRQCSSQLSHKSLPK